MEGKTATVDAKLKEFDGRIKGQMQLREGLQNQLKMKEGQMGQMKIQQTALETRMRSVLHTLVIGISPPPPHLYKKIP